MKRTSEKNKHKYPNELFTDCQTALFVLMHATHVFFFIIDYLLNTAFVYAQQHTHKSRKSHWIGMKRAAVCFGSSISHALTWKKKENVLSNLIFPIPFCISFAYPEYCACVKNQNGRFFFWMMHVVCVCGNQYKSMMLFHLPLIP